MSFNSNLTREKYVKPMKMFSSQATLRNYNDKSSKLLKANELSMPSTSSKRQRYNGNENQQQKKNFSDKDSSMPRNDNVLAVLLPHILDLDYVPIKQPLIFKIKECQLFEFGFDIPFDSFFDEDNNNFHFNVGNKKMSAELIAIGDNPVNLRESLEKNIEKNSSWEGMRKLKGNPEWIVDLEHVPLLNSNDMPEQLIIEERELQEILRQLSEKNINDRKKQDITRTREREADYEDLVEVEKKSTKIHKNDESYSITSNSCDVDPVQEDIAQRFKLLDQKKLLLSDSDVLSSTLKLTIDLMTTIFQNQKKSSTKIEVKISENDETFKIRKKNQIFIEGNIQLDLDKYEFAIKQSKPRNPYSLAYQLVHRAFPEAYWKNVTLGKKFYDSREIDYFSTNMVDSATKLPLIFIWGFKDPYTEPLHGEFNLVRGQRRVQSLIDHIFRISGFKQYNEEEENKVRVRLVKELSWKNKYLRQVEENKEKETDFSFNKNTIQDVWDDSFFKSN